MKKKLLVLGESYMNLQMKTAPASKDAKTVFGSSYSFHPYGAGAMTAISAAKLGGNCIFSTKLGEDSNGERLKKYYKSCGMDLSCVGSCKTEQTGMSITVYNDLTSGHTYITKGANLTFTKKDVEDAFSTYPDMFVLPQDDLLSEKAEAAKTMAIEDKLENDFSPLGNLSDVDAPTEMIDISSINIENSSKATEADFSETIIFSTSDAVEVAPAKTAKPLETESEENLALYAAELAAEKNIDMIVHYNKVTSKLPLAKFNNIKILVISDDMLYEASGIYPNSIDKTLRAIIPFSAKIKAQYYIIQQGNDSVFVYDGKYYDVVSLPSALKTSAHQESPRMHGTFIGAISARFLETMDIIDACKYALVTSILTRSKFGTLDHAPSLKEILDFTSEQ